MFKFKEGFFIYDVFFVNRKGKLKDYFFEDYD